MGPNYPPARIGAALVAASLWVIFPTSFGERPPS